MWCALVTEEQFVNWFIPTLTDIDQQLSEKEKIITELKQQAAKTNLIILTNPEQQNLSSNLKQTSYSSLLVLTRSESAPHQGTRSLQLSSCSYY